MMDHSRVAVRRMAEIRPPASMGSRYSLRCFTLCSQFAKHFERKARFVFVHLLEREARVGEHVISGPHLGRAFDADTAVDSSEADVSFEKTVAVDDAQHFTGDG
jgi:hypothetical protein